VLCLEIQQHDKDGSRTGFTRRTDSDTGVIWTELSESGIVLAFGFCR
jgi:hypothetical protein